MARQLTENQVKFLEVLFDEAGGDVVKAKKLAGYSDNTPTRLIIDSWSGTSGPYRVRCKRKDARCKGST